LGATSCMNFGHQIICAVGEIDLKTYS